MGGREVEGKEERCEVTGKETWKFAKRAKRLICI